MRRWQCVCVWERTGYESYFYTLTEEADVYEFLFSTAVKYDIIVYTNAQY